MLGRVLIIITILLYPAIANAQDAPKVVTLQKGQQAPFAGSLLNPSAVAHAIAEKENIASQCKLSEQYVEKKEKAKCDLLVNTADARLSALHSGHNSIMEIKNEEIERLNKIALERPNRYNHWWFGGGVVVGIVTSIAIFYASVEVTR